MMDLKKWGWIPNGLKLCKTCLKYLPKQRSWTLRDATELRKLKNVDLLWAVNQWMNSGRICPTCQIETAHDCREDAMDEQVYVQCWAEGLVQGVIVKRSFVDEIDT